MPTKLFCRRRKQLYITQKTRHQTHSKYSQYFTLTNTLNTLIKHISLPTIPDSFRLFLIDNYIEPNPFLKKINLIVTVANGGK
jgi:hypothetical protein